MKRLSFAIFLALTAVCQSQEVAPSLPITQAAQLAQSQLSSLKLGPDYFIRSLSLVGDRYEARFEPTKTSRAQVGEEPPPIVFKVIVVAMDGTTSVEEKTIPTKRSIRRSNTTTESPSKNE